MPLFSFFIPLHRDAKAFENTLASVLRSCPADTQVIVTHDGSYRDDYDLASEGVEFIAVGKSQRLAAHWNGALSRARGQFLVVLRPGVELDDDWSQVLLKAFASSDVAAVAPVIRSGTSAIFGISVDSSGTRSLVTRARDFSLGGTLEAVAFRNDALGWLPAVDDALDDLYLDAEIALGLKELGFRSGLETRWVVTGPIDSMIQRSAAPHGLAAARAMVRHRTLFSRAPSAGLWDFLPALWRGPKHFIHAWQRLQASRYTNEDRRVAEQFARAKSALQEFSATRRNGVSRRAA